MRILAGTTTWLRRIVDIALITLILVVLVAVGLGRLVPLTGRQSIVIGGASMEPAIPLGSAVVVTPVDSSVLLVGDVVSMKVDESATTYTHRIVDVVDRPDGRWVRTKGDANDTLDPTLIPPTAIVGRVDLMLPLIGYLVALMSLPVGILFVLGLAATLLAIAWLLESLEPPKVVAVRRPETWPASDRAPVRPRPVTARELVARSLAAIRDPAPMLLPTDGPATLRRVAANTRAVLTQDPEPAADSAVKPRVPRRRADAARDQQVRTNEVRRKYLRRGGKPRADRPPTR